MQVLSAPPPTFALGEIKSILSYRAGLRQLASRRPKGRTALVVYDDEGNVFVQVFAELDGQYRIVWEGRVGVLELPPANLLPGSDGYGYSMGERIRPLCEALFKQKFLAKTGSAHGPDLVPMR